MGRMRRRKVIAPENDSLEFKTRRSSLRVNLSYVSNLEDSGHGSLKAVTPETGDAASEESVEQNNDLLQTVRHNAEKPMNEDTATPASEANVTVVNAKSREKVSKSNKKNSLIVMKEKDQQLNKSCNELKDAIINKTKELFNQDYELTKKISEVFAGYTLPAHNVNENDAASDPRSPSIRVDIGNNDQIVMSGDGNKRNPVRVNSMAERSPTSHKNNECSQSIESTPKKTRTDEKVSRKTPETALRIPVARLFADDIDPNNSLSQMNPVDSPPKNKDTSAIMNCSTSPILSQGTRRSRFRLSLKKKLTKNIPSTSSRVSALPSAESFMNRQPLTCSSFIENPEKTNDTKDGENIENKTIELDDKTKSVSCRTIDLDDNENTSKTINVDNSSSISSMEITTVSSNMPIIRRSFQSIIRKSLNLENVVISSETTQKLGVSTQKQTSITRMSKESDDLDSTEKKSSSINSAKTSLEVNTSLDNKNLSDTVVQKENKEPNNSENCDEPDTILIQRQSSGNIRCSMQVNTSLDSVTKSSVSNNSDPHSKKTDSKSNTESEMEFRQPSSKNITRTTASSSSKRKSGMSLEKNLGTQSTKSNSGSESNGKIDSRQSTATSRQSTATTRSSMQVNTSLDSARRSPITKNVLDFNQILSMVEETQTENQNQESADSSKEKSSGHDSELENVSLMERIRNISSSKNADKKQGKEKGSEEIQSEENKSEEVESTDDNPVKSRSLRSKMYKSITESKKRSKSNPSVKTKSKTNTDSIVDQDSPAKRRSTKTKNSSLQTKSSEDENTSPQRKSTSNENNSPKRKSTEVENDSPKRRCTETKKNKSIEVRNTSTKRKSTEPESSPEAKKSKDIQDMSKTIELDNSKQSDTRKSNERRRTGEKNVSSASNESSIIEATPYPASRSVLFKTMIKNNIAMNTLDPRKLVDLTDSEDSNDETEAVIKKKPTPRKKRGDSVKSRTSTTSLSDTVVLDSTDEVSSDSDAEREPVVIDESLNDTKDNSIQSKNDKNTSDEKTNKKQTAKRKLYPLRDNSQLASFSPAEIQESPRDKSPKKTRRVKRRNKLTQKMKREKNPEPDDDSEPVENEIVPTQKKEKPKKKPRKIVSKKIVVKKLANLTMMDEMLDQDQGENKSSQRLSERNSLREFDLRRLKGRKKQSSRKGHRIVIVVTGLDKGDKDMVKSVIKALGCAVLEPNVTPRTTHVISSGVRTINLLKGILRGCWLLSLEWALKSLEEEQWLDPAPYEMSHFSKAVQENRRDRKLFGKAYVPELFVTCGPIYIENGTSPPAPVLKELVKIAGGRITEDYGQAEIVVGKEDLREVWILDSITTGELQTTEQYKRN